MHGVYRDLGAGEIIQGNPSPMSLIHQQKCDEP
jgi:hypothetical protein